MIFDFKCPTGHVFERNVPSSVHNVECPECSKEAKRLISAPFLKIPGTGDYPGAAMKWAKQHEKEARRNPQD